MPTYEYRCPGCGEFDALRPMAERDEACACPGCGSPSPRVLLSAPALYTLPSNVKKAHAINERSSHSPRCSCASHGKPAKEGARGFPARRPWMISH